uniref:MND1-interacting protein 1 n=1 Tax=Cajanus cajan TaxID=3821 RepID=A0A151STJ3_CAJCA|nr:MND1-interacting protein 1 [Cajanus cajan]
MISLVASCSSQMSPSVSCQEKGSRNKRKFRADPPLADPNNIIPAPQLDCLSYEFSAEKFEITPDHGQVAACDFKSKEEPETDESNDADWSDLTEAQLEELVLINLDTIFKSAIKKIVACGYTEEITTKAILRPGICYGCSRNSQSKKPVVAGIPGGNNLNSQIICGPLENEGESCGSDCFGKAFNNAGKSQSPLTEEKCGINGANTVPAFSSPVLFSATNTDLSLSLSSKIKPSTQPVCFNTNSSYTGISYDKSPRQWIPQDGKDEMILKLVPRIRELQNQLQEWTEWANQKVMQAARRLSKDKEMEAAKLHATKTAARCQEVSSREKKTQMKFQSWEKQKSLFQEELMTEKRKLSQLLLELEQARMQHEQVEGRWQHEAKTKEELLLQASSIRKEREQIEESGKSKEDMIKLKAERNLQRYRDDIHKLEKEIVQLRLKTDSSKIAALRMGIDGSYTSRFLDMKNGRALKEPQTSFISELVIGQSVTGGVKRDRECVMCLSEEMSVVFLPCAHQVVCTTCNELHEKQGMQDCPSCRSPIQRRIAVRFPRT